MEGEAPSQASLIHSSLLGKQWVETNQSNFCIYPTDIRLLPPHGTMLTTYEWCPYECWRMLDKLISTHPKENA
jgi:hypothetical protein